MPTSRTAPTLAGQGFKNPTSNTLANVASLPQPLYLYGFVVGMIAISNTKVGKLGTGLLVVAILFQLGLASGKLGTLTTTIQKSGSTTKGASNG